jgi:peroxiredoxin
MPLNRRVGDALPDIELPTSEGRPLRLSKLTGPSALDRHLGFADGYPLILVFYRGFFCPRDQQQMR